MPDHKRDGGEIGLHSCGTLRGLHSPDRNPFRIFVYAGLEERLARCRKRLPSEEQLSDKELKQRILSIDKNRAAYYHFYTGQVWGDKAHYDLCINTAFCPIDKLVPAIQEMLS
ncbi:MAG: cytidylate kinase family protein [Victivallales bacterium]